MGKIHPQRVFVPVESERRPADGNRATCQNGWIIRKRRPRTSCGRPTREKFIRGERQPRVSRPGAQCGRYGRAHPYAQAPPRGAPASPRGAEPDEEGTDHQRDESLQRAEHTPAERSSGTSPAKSRIARAASSARVADAIGTRRRRSVRRTAARLPPCRRETRGSIHVAPHVVAEVIQPRPHARCAQMAEIAREAKRTIAGDEQRRHHQADERSGDVHGQSPDSHSFVSISVAP